MEFRNLKVMFAALGVAGMMLVGCGGDGSTSLKCEQDSECLESEICHPGAKVCVQTCSSSADCSAEAKTCDAVSATDDRSICKCSTTELCNTNSASSDMLCSDTYSVCVPKCSADTDCGTGETCDTASGVCKPGSTTGDACTGEGQSTCSYGEFCGSGTCAEVPAPACENYTNLSAADRAQIGTTGAIIFKATTTGSSLDANFCGAAAPQRVKVTVSAYSSTPFPATKDELNGLFYVKVNGSKVSGPSIISSSAGNYTVTGDNRDRADIVLNFCVPESSTTLSTGLYFTNGNFFCHQANY